MRVSELIPREWETVRRPRRRPVDQYCSTDGGTRAKMYWTATFAVLLIVSCLFVAAHLVQPDVDSNVAGKVHLKYKFFTTPSIAVLVEIKRARWKI